MGQWQAHAASGLPSKSWLVGFTASKNHVDVPYPDPWSTLYWQPTTACLCGWSHLAKEGATHVSKTQGSTQKDFQLQNKTQEKNCLKN